ncbi:MAG: hypothetical protein M3R21_10315 [Candidatus Dormibacteraeota bacterium]|nr:hypothetical protein [Candidatus Dormibacteraeota bacterium]
MSAIESGDVLISWATISRTRSASSCAQRSRYGRFIKPSMTCSIAARQRCDIGETPAWFMWM